MQNLLRGRDDTALQGRIGSTRSLFFVAIRLVVVLAALALLLVSLTKLHWAPIRLNNSAMLLIGLFLNQLALFVFAARLRMALDLFGMKIGRLSAVRIHLESMFYFFAVPMTAGLEIVRFIKIRQIQPEATTAKLSSALVFDRLLGAISALVIVVLLLPAIGSLIAIKFPPLAVGGVLLIAAIVCTAAFVSRRMRALAIDASRLVQGRWLALAELLILSTFMHLLFAAGVYSVALGLDLPVKLLQTLFAVTAGMLLLAVPVSFGGLGLAEAGTSGIFLAMGHSPGVALAAAALPYIARLVGAIEGAIWELNEVFEAGSAAICRRWPSLGRQALTQQEYRNER
jgi:uncharacterized membrane protein YbhN (UPF0104 family)